MKNFLKFVGMLVALGLFATVEIYLFDAGYVKTAWTIFLVVFAVAIYAGGAIQGMFPVKPVVPTVVTVEVTKVEGTPIVKEDGV